MGMAPRRTKRLGSPRNRTYVGEVTWGLTLVRADALKRAAQHDVRATIPQSFLFDLPVGDKQRTIKSNVSKRRPRWGFEARAGCRLRSKRRRVMWVKS